MTLEMPLDADSYCAYLVVEGRSQGWSLPFRPLNSNMSLVPLRRYDVVC